MTQLEQQQKLSEYDKRISAATDTEEKAEIQLEKYHCKCYFAIENAKLAQVILIDPTLPDVEPDPEREWIFPGHAHTHHCMEQVGALREKIKTADPVHIPHLEKTADDLEKRAHKRDLCRMHFEVARKGETKIYYTFIHRGGLYTDVFHTFPKIYGEFKNGWTEQDAKDFYTEMKASPSWTQKKPTVHEFNTAVRKGFMDAATQIKIDELRRQNPTVKA